jgi:hypothetical protein
VITLKKLVFLIAALLLLFGATTAWCCPGIGLFADADRSICEVISPGGFYPFEMWIWIQPHIDNGTICNEFRICYPPNVIQSTVTWNDPIISVMLGDLPSGLSVCYIICQYDFFWIAHQACYLTDTTPAWIEVCAHPDVGVVQYADCTPGYPVWPSTIWNHLALNQPCVIGTEESSWGAIKSMVSE